MPALRNYYLFISHAWRYNTDYYNLERLLINAPYFQFRNYSVPTHDPLVDPGTRVGQQRLEDLLDRQIRPTHCLLVIAGMYAAHRFWIDKEIGFAQLYNKPIIGIAPWGQERLPQSVQFAAHAFVRWNTDSILGAIRQFAK